jgi:hypothetical protein
MPSGSSIAAEFEVRTLGELGVEEWKPREEMHMRAKKQTTHERVLYRYAILSDKVLTIYCAYILLK